MDTTKVKDIGKKFMPFINFTELKKDKGFRTVSLSGNNLLYLRKKLEENINDSAIEDLGTDWMLKMIGDGNIKFSRRWAWLYRHYIWASRVPAFRKRRARVVDIGCDVGEIRKLISRSFYTKNPYYVGIDMDHSLLVSGFKRIQMRTPAIYIQQDATLGFKFIKSNSVDLVYAGEIIEHFEKRFGIKLLKEIYRMLKPGGNFLLSTPNKVNTKGYEFHVYEYKIKELEKIVRKIGFDVTSIWGWQTTEKEIKKRGRNLLKMYDIFKNKGLKDLVVPLFAYLDPSVSDAFCLEGRKPLKNR